MRAPSDVRRRYIYSQRETRALAAAHAEYRIGLNYPRPLFAQHKTTRRDFLAAAARFAGS